MAHLAPEEHPEEVTDRILTLPNVISFARMLMVPVYLVVLLQGHDLAATLLAQLHIPYDDFTFSKNVVDPAREHFAYYTFPDGFGYVDREGAAVYDCASQSILVTQNDSSAVRLNRGKAYLQKLYDDLSRR